MEHSNSASTQIPNGIVLDGSICLKVEEDRDKVSCVPSRQLIGPLLHLSNTAQPDIVFAVGFLS